MERIHTNMVEFLGPWDSPPLMRSIIRSVADGEPVPLDRLAAEAGLSVDQVESRLTAEPGVDWDAQGRLLGFGLTQRPTRHRFVVGDRVLYGFCAADTLMFPIVLGVAATVDSTCPATGRPIRVELTGESVTSVDPDTAVVSQVCLCSPITDIRAEGCVHGHFFATAEAAEPWRREHPDGEVRPVHEFFSGLLTVGRDLGWTSVM